MEKFYFNVDDWNVNTEVLSDKIFNKEKLLFLIKDEKNNKFGFYYNTNIGTNMNRSNLFEKITT